MKLSNTDSLARRRKAPSLSGLNPVISQPTVTREQIAATALKKSTTVEINGKIVNIDPQDVETICQLGKGAYGVVELIRHKPSGIDMAVKKTAISQEQKRFLMDRDVLVKADDCPYIVKFYGASFWEGDLWIFMEIMDSSLDKFYRLAYGKGRLSSPPRSSLNSSSSASDSLSANSALPTSSLISIPEYVLGKIAFCVVQALNHLHKIDIIHRDVKPSNILINKAGEVKLCDFGISGPLVDSVAKTIEVGCKPYMAPERINPPANNPGYDIRSDVWSLGISMLEMATGEFPYSTQSNNFFVLLKSICNGDPPKLPPNRFSSNFEDFINQCLQKDYQQRPYYGKLLEHPFVVCHQNKNISEYVTQVLNRKDIFLT